MSTDNRSSLDSTFTIFNTLEEAQDYHDIQETKELYEKAPESFIKFDLNG